MKRNYALIILYDDEKRILLQFRDNDAPNYPNCWGCFGGGIKTNELPKDAVKRETFEELNYKLINPKLVIAVEPPEEFCKGKQFYFIEKCDDKSSLRLQEGKDMGWFSFPEIRDLNIADHNKPILFILEQFM